ncbi:UxaA family hydrolase [Vulcanisaeta thermophila]|uniref:UxaA family hydrolase n=1 Tax=Vulcanisaeta thermophila TaxID=867917 RepID=UPI000852BF38|nr:UxaA family hydrolase [Vulcanisaeta thermophila]
MSLKFVIHNKLDNVGVAIDDIKAGEDVMGVYIEDRSEGPRLRALNDIPLGHKIALRDIRAGERVIKYGRVIGVATRDIRAGEHVHIRNLKSLRWGDLAKRGGSK